MRARRLAPPRARHLDSTVHLSFGDVPAEEYLWQLTADALVHSWDLARATGQDEDLDESVVPASAAVVRRARGALPVGGWAIGPAVAAVDDSPTRRLLGRFGRETSGRRAAGGDRPVQPAFNDHDLDAIRSMITDDCVFVDTSPPRGGTHKGADAVIAAFGKLFADSPDAFFETLGGFVG